MKPINALQRRKAFLSYLFIFVLALVPVCISIFMYGRVDHAENAFLREKYEEKRQMKGEMSNERNVYKKMEDDAFKLKQEVTGALDNATTILKAGNIDTKIQDVEVALSNFKSKSYRTPTDSALVRILEHQISTLQKLSHIYRATFNELQDSKDELKDLEKDYSKLKEERY